MSNFISKEELLIIRSKISDIKINELQFRNSQLEYENVLSKLYIKYGLSENDQINPVSGEIINSDQDENVEKCESQISE